VAESLIEAALRNAPPGRLAEVLRRFRLADFLEHTPEGFEDVTAYDAVDYLWQSLTARPEQRIPTVEWDTWVIQAGRGWGKTRTGAQASIEIAEEAARLVEAGRLAPEEARLHLVGATAADVRDVMIKGPAGILRCSPPWFPCHYEPSNRRLVWPNGVEALLFSAEEPDRLRGPQCIFAWADELAAWKYAEEAWDNLELGCRLGPKPRIVVTTTPRPIPQFKKIIRQRGAVVTRGTTRDNVRNLNADRVRKLEDKYEGTRLGRQELGGELLDDNPNALWRRADIDAGRLTRQVFVDGHRDNLVRVVVSVDPAVSDNPETSNETGIVVAAKGWCSCRGPREMHGYVLDDLSLIDTPRKWALAVGGGYRTWRADRVVAETNQGGNLVTENLRLNSETQNLPVSGVHVHEGKRLRAEPAAALYEQVKVHHVGSFAVLEDQMTDWDPASQDSPDRIDALVQALTHLLLEEPAPEFTLPGEPILPRRS
jgi:phage terminase large subunit-like protein